MDKLHNRLAIMLRLIQTNKEYLPEDNYKAMLTVMDELFELLDKQLGERQDFVINSQIQ